MQTSILIYTILAIELPFLRISPLLLIRIATIALLYAVAILFFVIYIQSIGSGIGIFSGLFHVTLISQSIETFFLLSRCFNSYALVTN
jgi:NADH-ubiquinone oxidoreductase chain 2